MWRGRQVVNKHTGYLPQCCYFRVLKMRVRKISLMNKNRKNRRVTTFSGCLAEPRYLSNLFFSLIRLPARLLAQRTITTNVIATSFFGFVFIQKPTEKVRVIMRTVFEQWQTQTKTHHESAGAGIFHFQRGFEPKRQFILYSSVMSLHFICYF